MYFVLLKGTHVELEKKFQVETAPDGQGVMRVTKQPVVKSDRNLLKAFGPDKFRRISNDEAKTLLPEAEKEAGRQDAVKKESDPASSVQKAAEEGAAEIAKPPGVDVTEKFPELSEWPTVVIYYKRGVGYFIADKNKVITEKPVKRPDIVEWVRNYMEG